MPAFTDVLSRITEYFRDNRDEIRSQGEQLTSILRQLDPDAANSATTLDAAPLQSARDKIAESFDREFGGIGTAPKFPHPAMLERLLRHWRATASSTEPDVEALFMVSLTLSRMAEGGIYDQLAGGFCRYSVDRYWQIPHFEKMLYDNGPLLANYAQAHLATGESLFARIASETADYILADLRAPNGGFYSTRDADSEGKEGLYYVWTPDEVKALLPAEDYAPFARYFGLTEDANFEGAWHLSVRDSFAAVAEALDADEDDVAESINRSRQVLLDARATRVPPGRDEKQLTAWNALAIRGLAIAGRALHRPELIDAAAGATDFVRGSLVRDGRLYASHKDGQTKFAAYLDDHAFMLDALLELLQARWNSDHLQFAIELADLLLEHFYDHDNGGFYFTADDSESLMHRPKPLADEATPSGNGVAALSMQRLGFLLGETRYLRAAEQTLKSAWKPLQEHGHGHVTLLSALEETLSHPEIIILRGEAVDIDTWQSAAASLYAPRRLIFAIESGAADLPGALADRKAVDGETLAYRCIGEHCSLPLRSWDALAAELRESG